MPMVNVNPAGAGVVRTLAVNCSILLNDRPVPERLRAVADAGFRAVEFWWPFPTATPSAGEMDAFAEDVRRSGLALVGLNLFAGDMPAGDRGVLSWPGREDELLASAEVAARLGERLGTRRFNALYGNRIDGVTPEQQDALATANLRRVAPLFDPIGGVVMIEPVSGAPAYPVRTAADAMAVVERAGPRNLGLLLDLYHLAANGDDVAAAIRAYGAGAAHVQIADAPGRGVPGSAGLPLVDWVRALRACGYPGAVALEYVATADDPFTHFDFETWKDLA